MKYIIWFTISACIEMYFFMMQRVALEIMRSLCLPSKLRFILVPKWYKLAWLAIASKWISVVFIFIKVGWWQSLVCAAIPSIYKLCDSSALQPFQ
jgi:hypothetical protein